MSEMLWTSQEIASATGGEALGDSFNVSGLSIDTRTLQLGDLFVALTGARDGHDYLAAAFGAGATGALVSKLPSPVIPDGAADPGPSSFDLRALPGPGSTLRSGRDDGLESVAAIKVDDTLKALERLAAAARDRSPARRCAVTGSVGKTSVTQAIAAALRLAGRSHAPVKSFNNHIGVPLTLAALPRDAEFAVLELGMNHAGEIWPPVAAGAPARGGDHHRRARAHRELSPMARPASRAQRRRSSRAWSPVASLMLNADDRWFEMLADDGASGGRAGAELRKRTKAVRRAAASPPFRWRRGEGSRVGVARADVPEAGARGCAASSVTSCRQRALTPIPALSSFKEEGRLCASLHGRALFRFLIAQTGAHWGPNSLAVLLAVEALGAPALRGPCRR